MSDARGQTVQPGYLSCQQDILYSNVLWGRVIPPYLRSVASSALKHSCSLCHLFRLNICSLKYSQLLNPPAPFSHQSPFHRPFTRNYWHPHCPTQHTFSLSCGPKIGRLFSIVDDSQRPVTWTGQCLIANHFKSNTLNTNHFWEVSNNANYEVLSFVDAFHHLTIICFNPVNTNDLM